MSLEEIQVQILDTPVARREFVDALDGKRVLHAKGFGSSFKEPNESQVAQEEQQEKEAVQAMLQFSPDYIVVDGDPWGTGFQRYIKAFVDKTNESGGAVPGLIWIKNVYGMTDDGGVANAEEREKRIKEATEWAKECNMAVIVYWVDWEEIVAKINRLFGNETWTKLKDEQFNARGVVRITGETSPSWVTSMDAAIKAAVSNVEQREDLQGFEKCSFENSAKGNTFFDVLDNPKCAIHGAVSFGGGESVLLEFGTWYLNSASGFDRRNVALFPFSRGREGVDPELPRHVGGAFARL